MRSHERIYLRMKQIRRIRQDKDIKQKDLAARCRIRQATLSEIERGRKRPRLDTLLKIARELNVTVDSLLQDGC